MPDKKPSIQSLTGLRFIAALTVFIHHLSGRFGFAVNGYSIGSAAVTFFFVLSGFILVYAYSDRLNNWTEVKRFYFNRFARIWPLHVACLIISILTLGTHFTTNRFEGPEAWKQLTASIILLQSWSFQRDWIFAYNGVSWSISTEAFFYLVFPLLAFGAARWFRFTLPFLLSTVFISGLVFYRLSTSEQPPDIAFSLIGQVNPVLRLLDFLTGVVAGYIFLKRKHDEGRPYQFLVDTVQEVCVVLLIVAAFIGVTESKLIPQIIRASWGGAFLGGWFRVEYPVILFGISVYTFAKSTGLLSRLAANRVMVYLGDVSYAFYMIHFTVIRNVYHSHASYGELSSITLAILTFLISLGLSIVLYEWIEMPAKTVLNAWYDRSCRRHHLIRSKGFLLVKTAIALGLVAVPLWFLASNVTNYKRSPEFNQIIRQSKPEFKNINFGSQIRLLGLTTTKKAKKLEIKFAWFKRIDFPHRRLVFLINKSNKQVARGQHNQESIQDARPGQYIIDVAYVPLEAIKPGREIVVWFRGNEIGAMPVDKGKRRLREKALVISTNGKPVSSRENKTKNRKAKVPTS